MLFDLSEMEAVATLLLLLTSSTPAESSTTWESTTESSTSSTLLSKHLSKDLHKKTIRNGPRFSNAKQTNDNHLIYVHTSTREASSSAHAHTTI